MEAITYLVGFMGSGKTYTGQKMAEASGAHFIDLDAFIEQGEGRSIAELFADLGESGFRVLEREYLHRTIALPTPLVVATGGGAPCFFDNMDWMNAHGRTIWLNVPVSVLVERLKPEKAQRPLIAEVADEDLEGFIREKLMGRGAFYGMAGEALI